MILFNLKVGVNACGVEIGDHLLHAVVPYLANLQKVLLSWITSSCCRCLHPIALSVQNIFATYPRAPGQYNLKPRPSYAANRGSRNPHHTSPLSCSPAHRWQVGVIVQEGGGIIEDELQNLKGGRLWQALHWDSDGGGGWACRVAPGRLDRTAHSKVTCRAHEWVQSGCKTTQSDNGAQPLSAAFGPDNPLPSC